MAEPLPQAIVEEIIRHASPGGGAFLVGGHAYRCPDCDEDVIETLTKLRPSNP